MCKVAEHEIHLGAAQHQLALVSILPLSLRYFLMTDFHVLLDNPSVLVIAII